MANNIQVLKQTELLGQLFAVYGTPEEPLFLAKDVATWIEHTDVSKMVQSVDDDEKLTRTLFVSGQNREVWMLTENGLYEVLMLSRKSIAKEFKKGVKKILHDIRTTGQYAVKPLTPAQQLLANAQMLVEIEQRQMEQERRQLAVESKVALIEEEDLDGEKSAYVKSKASRGNNAGTWMHPILFVKFAMWINPRFEVQVIKFVYDQMIAYRNEAGDSYKELASAVSKLVGKDFMRVAMSKIAKGINYCVFGEHETLIRNQFGDEKKMRELFSFQRKVADLINEGFLKSFDDAMAYLKMMFGRMQTPKVLLAE